MNNDTTKGTPWGAFLTNIFEKARLFTVFYQAKTASKTPEMTFQCGFWCANSKLNIRKKSTTFVVVCGKEKVSSALTPKNSPPDCFLTGRFESLLA